MHALVFQSAPLHVHMYLSLLKCIWTFSAAVYKTSVNPPAYTKQNFIYSLIPLEAPQTASLTVAGFIWASKKVTKTKNKPKHWYWILKHALARMTVQTKANSSQVPNQIQFHTVWLLESVTLSCKDAIVYHTWYKRKICASVKVSVSIWCCSHPF